MATMDDIARELSISKGTVSKALSGAKDVGSATRQAVLNKAAELGYTRAPRKTDIRRIALFIINMKYEQPEDFGYDIVQGFFHAAEPAGFQVEIVPLTLELQRSVRYDDYMATNNYCGSLFLGLDLLCPWLREFETCTVPAVLYDNAVHGNPNVTHVGVDNAEGMELAVKHLVKLGHRKIGYLSSTTHSYVYQQRYLSFYRAMQENGLAIDGNVMGSAHHISDCLSQHLPRLLEQGCTAIVCSHDLLAHSVMVHCRELGLRIPEDISILGFDDVPLCRYTIPPLTTIRQNRTALGKSAFYALSSQLSKVSLSTFLLHPELIERASCAAAPQQ